MYQSAHRKDHSTETVLNVLDCLLVNADERLVSLIAPVDLSVVLDMHNYSILLRKLEVTFGVQDTALGWFASYLSDRCQSAPSTLVYGVSQGSVLGPASFMWYSQTLWDIIITHGCNFHNYADDTALS